MTLREEFFRPRPFSRRHFVRTGLAGLLAPALVGCGSDPTAPPTSGANRLTARPGAPSIEPVIGQSALEVGGFRDGLLYVPEAYDPTRAWPLFVALHGATGDADDWRGFFPAGDDYGMVIVVPDARDITWDAVYDDFGPDVTFIDAALTHVFQRVRVDPDRICLGGFSDGASYALSLGASNGDLFSELLAFSPGFMRAEEPIVGRPRVWVSHGTADTVLPVQSSRDVIVPALREAGYEVTYREYEGVHRVPSAIAREALDWFVG